MEQMRIKHNETGRSMVEMLGVLAVVGVLSIGGVAGYRYAVDKMNANEIINELKKRAITASQQRVLGQGINLAEYGAILGKYEVTPANGYPEDPAFFGLEIKAVPQKVCQHIVDSEWALPAEMKIGNLIMEKGTACPDEFNDISFAFHNTLDQTQEIGEIITPPEQPTQKCEAGYYPLADGTCKEDKKCSDPNQFWNGYTQQCTVCPTEGNPIQNDVSDIEDSCTKCTNAQVDIRSGTRYCIYCPSNRVTCGNTCCEAGKQCQVNTSVWPYTYKCTSGLDSTNNECLTNADCNKNGKTGEFCKNVGGCGQMVIGTCQPATLYNNGASIDFYGKSVVRSQDDDMGWYAAKNFCEAHNMSLFNPKPYCTADEWFSIQSDGGGPCTNLDVTDDPNWNWSWTGSAYSSCSALHVNLSYGKVANATLEYDYNAALCEGEGEYVPPVVSTEVTATQTESTEPEASVSEEDERCGGHGTWQSGLYGGCYCDSGWAGMYCDIDISCSGHGWWSGDALHCQCDPGWSGRSCEDHVDVCNERGNFVSAFYEEQSTCWCNEGWTGTHCEISTCSGHGSWCGTACTCDRGWSGTFCSNNLDVCNGRGYWQNRSGGDNSCVCDTGWTGTYCEVGTCNGQGTWNSSTKTCTCSTGWTGTYCDTSTCYSHGTWNSSTKKCTCSTGWTGTYCDTSTCSGHGTWNSSTKTCTCSTGWTGTYCDASTCNGYGTWNGSACECSAGWGGTYCSLPCSGNGSWVEDACSCQAGWAGNDCSIDLCVHGSWVEDACSCTDGWTGSDCSIPT